MRRDVLIDGYTQYVVDPDRSDVTADDDGGLYHRDTRHLSMLTTRINGAEFVTLGREMPQSHRRTVVSTDQDSSVNRVDDKEQKRSDIVAQHRQAVSEGDGLVQEVTFDNHSSTPFSGRIEVEFDSDFSDVFEVRGYTAATDREIDTATDNRSVRYTYEYDAADGRTMTRGTAVSFDRKPTEIEPGRAAFDIDIDPQESATITIQVWLEMGGEASPTPPHPARDRVAGAVDFQPVQTGSEGYDRVFNRAGEDLSAQTTETEYGPVALAGAPWFATVFGRDSLIAAYQAIHMAPSMAEGTLRYLAAYQGTAFDEISEEEPGKIFHEIRDGELSHREMIPHTPYYGTIDATPLWVTVLAEHHRWTGSDEVVTELADSLDGALSWINTTRADHGDDPFLYYERSPNAGLLHKAWRDTPGSVQFPDGRTAEGAIASVEVQGYVYRALRDAAHLYDEVLDDHDEAATLRAEADELAEAFEAEFWLPDQEYYAVAKIGSGEIVPTPTSNVGHCLWAGIVDDDRAARVARKLLSEDLFSGWGVRTMSTEVDGYSPVSYHLGSVWPHDNSLVALGLAEYGHHDAVEQIADGILDACTQFDDSRIPEVFCGFDGELSPTEYPSSCVPQAWSAATPFALLRALFDLSPSENGVEIGATPKTLAESAIGPITERWK